MFCIVASWLARPAPTLICALFLGKIYIFGGGEDKYLESTYFVNLLSWISNIRRSTNSKIVLKTKNKKCKSLKKSKGLWLWIVESQHVTSIIKIYINCWGDVLWLMYNNSISIVRWRDHLQFNISQWCKKYCLTLSVYGIAQIWEVIVKRLTFMYVIVVFSFFLSFY